MSYALIEPNESFSSSAPVFPHFLNKAWLLKDHSQVFGMGAV